MSDDSDDDDLALPEPPEARPETPGSASWAERRHGGPPPYEESDEQAEAKWEAFIAGMPEKERAERLERRRKRRARIAQGMEKARLGERGRAG